MILLEVLSYGAIAACSERFSLFVTINSNELNLWIRTAVDKYEHLNTTPLQIGEGFASLSVQDMLIRAERVIEEYLLEVNEEIAREHYV